MLTNARARETNTRLMVADVYIQYDMHFAMSALSFSLSLSLTHRRCRRHGGAQMGNVIDSKCALARAMQAQRLSFAAYERALSAVALSVAVAARHMKAYDVRQVCGILSLMRQNRYTQVHRNNNNKNTATQKNTHPDDHHPKNCGAPSCVFWWQ